MKILIINEDYPKYLQSFYSKNHTSTLDYNSHNNLLTDDHFATTGAWIEPLTSLGYEVNEICFNNEILQHHWVREFAGKTSKFFNYKNFQTVFLQIEFYRPEIIYISNPHIFNESVIAKLKSEFPFVKVFLCYLGTPYTAHAIAEYDVCFTTLNKYAKDIQSAGKLAFRLPHAFNKRILEKLSVSSGDNMANDPYKLCFAGGIVRSNDMHATRLEYVEFLFEHVPIEIYSEIYYLTLWADLKENIQKKMAMIIINSLRSAGFSEDKLARLPAIGRATRWQDHHFKLFSKSLMEIVQPPVYAMDMYRMFANNKIVFNIHVDNAGDEAANIRLFEATGVGACLLTDAKSNMTELFVPDEEVLVYSSKEECVEKVKWLLANTAACRAIAKAGKERVLRDHTFQNRASIFSEAIQKALAKK